MSKDKSKYNKEEEEILKKNKRFSKGNLSNQLISVEPKVQDDN
jgi:hypothetical protein